MEVTKVLVPFSGQELTAIKSAKKNELCFLGQEIMAVTHHKNISQALKNADCKLGEDYFVLKKKEYPKLFQEIVDLFTKRDEDGTGLSTKEKFYFKGNTQYIQELTLVYESGFWLLSLNSKLASRNNLKKWLSNDVLKDLRVKGEYHFEPTIKKTITYLVKDTISGLYKIGKTQDLEKRLSQLSNSNVGIQLIDFIERDVEKKLHDTYRFYRIFDNREWFDFKEDFSSFYNIFKELKQNTNYLLLTEEERINLGTKNKLSYKNTIPDCNKNTDNVRARKSSDSLMVEVKDHLVLSEQDNNVKLSDLKEFDKIAIALFCEAEKIGLKFSN